MRVVGPKTSEIVKPGLSEKGGIKTKKRNFCCWVGEKKEVEKSLI